VFLQVVVLDEKDYRRVHSQEQVLVSADRKFHFCKDEVSLFRDWEIFRLYRFASLLVHRVAAAGTVLLERGKISDGLCFVFAGSVDILLPTAKEDSKAQGDESEGRCSTARRPRDIRRDRSMVTLSTLGRADYFGETGLIASAYVAATGLPRPYTHQSSCA
jgi:CRP-like cAMP-binding protein